MKVEWQEDVGGLAIKVCFTIDRKEMMDVRVDLMKEVQRCQESGKIEDWLTALMLVCKLGNPWTTK